jgi:hypothetical protein
LNIAELFVRVRGDTTDVESKMRGVRRSMDDFGRSTAGSTQALEGHKLSLGKVERALAGYVGHALGANSVTEQLSTAFGSFALGGGVVSGVLLGVGAIVAIYEHVTAAAREAKKEQDALIKSFLDAQKIKGFAGGAAGQVVEALNARVKAAQDRVDVLTSTNATINDPHKLSGGFLGGVQQATVTQKAELDRANADLAAATAERDAILKKGAEDTDRTYAGNLSNLVSSNRATEAERQHSLDLIKAYRAELAKLAPTDTAGRASLSGMISTLEAPFLAEAAEAARQAKEFAGLFGKLRAEADKTYKEMNDEKKNWWKSFIDSGNEALTITQQVSNAVNASRPTVVEALQSLVPTAQFSMPNVLMPFEGLTDAQKDQLRQLGVLTDKSDKNATMLHDAIWGSASQLANTIVSALNIGGGGKGSSLGGALGSTAGFALGFIFGGGPVGGAIGSTLGNIAGSFLGGLFDHHKKSVDTNTQALKALTQAIVQNAPTGFKWAASRYDATDVGGLGRSLRRYASRGGVNPLLVGT